MSLVTAGAPAPVHETKQRLLEAGLTMLLERGYHGLSVQDLLDDVGVPKGSFYHHFESKQDMALQAVELYTAMGHRLLDVALAPDGRPALQRVRDFFDRLGSLYREQGYLGCLLGALGQELSGTSDAFRGKIEACVASIAARVGECLEEAQLEGELSAAVDPRELADVLVNAWEGAALRSRLLRSPEPLRRIVDFCLGAGVIA